MQIAVDTGGTFTDCVYSQNGTLRVVKVISTPEEPETAVVGAVKAIANGAGHVVRHGTTVGTNCLLERKGAPVAFVATGGFEHIILIGRQARPWLYDLSARSSHCIVRRELCFGISERTEYDGKVLRRPTEQELGELAEKIRASAAESIAICLLFSFANPENEKTVSDALASLGLPISVSHLILPEFREFERGSTAAVNAYLAPKAGRYVQRLDTDLQSVSQSSRLEVMQSSGGIIPAAFAAEQPVRTVLSGPAGGVVGAFRVAQQSGYSKIITFDMGGTSTDVCLVDGNEGGPRASNEASIAQMPISVPMLDIHTIGAGGGSLAHFDAAGVLRVGPESAGANPGPICYGRGTQPTVSDANVILGRLHPDHFLDGKMRLHADRARSYMEDLRGPIPTVMDYADAVVRIAEAAMERAIRLISVERGHDPREFTLVAFGGAGPLHACSLAAALRIPKVLVPVHPGALSALGILLADSVRDYSKTVMLKADANLEPLFRELEEKAQSECGTPCTSYSRALDLRYAGQGYELTVPAEINFIDTFHRAHQKRYGHADGRRLVEIVNVRVRATTKSEPIDLPTFPPGGQDAAQAQIETRTMIFAGQPQQGKVFMRERLDAGNRIDGPAIVVEYSATTVIQPGWSALVDTRKNLVLEAQQ